jgi:hypothetical protein
MNGVSSSSADLLSVNALVAVRLAEHDTEYSSRIEDIDGDTLIVAAPPGANAALLASGERDVELSWVTPRGRHEQLCALLEHINNGGLKQWRLRPTGTAKLIQRRRYVRVPAALAVLLVMPGEVLTATTVDVSEGGFRVRMPKCEIAAETPVGIQVNMVTVSSSFVASCSGPWRLNTARPRQCCRSSRPTRSPTPSGGSSSRCNCAPGLWFVRHEQAQAHRTGAADRVVRVVACPA